ncbi:aspartic peptidase domain-containing protein [Mycena crocata]|nr:aspartic peptidase domain-containing protein [Mycena crocata]
MLRSAATFFSLLLLFSNGFANISAASQHHHGRPSPMDTMSDDDIINKMNDRYTVNLTVGDTTVNVILDTGSTDLWLDPPAGISVFESTGVAAKLAFGDGSTFVKGTIGLGAVEMAGFSIPAQAFLNVTENIGFEFECTNGGTCGLVGLGFDDPQDAVIPGTLTAAGINGTVVGKSVLSSIFAHNPHLKPFFALSLSRLGDTEDSADASLNIGELDPQYADVQEAPWLPQFPVDSGAWSILSEGISVNGVPIPWPSNTNTTPDGQNVVVLDSGTTNILLPSEIRDAIYSVVPGAVLAKNSTIGNPKFSTDTDVWVVPCGTVIKMKTQFGGQTFPIHPLDMTDLVVRAGPDGQNYTICIGPITNGGSITSGFFDALYGDTFLRNVYAVFNFGEQTTTPHIQLLSQTDEGAAADFARVRAKSLLQSPPELAPADIIRLFDSTPESSIASGNKLSSNLADTDTDGASRSTDSQITKYAPIVIGLLGANLLILVILALLGVVSLVRNGRHTGAPSSRYVPVRLTEDTQRSENKLYADGPHERR